MQVQIITGDAGTGKVTAYYAINGGSFAKATFSGLAGLGDFDDAAREAVTLIDNQPQALERARQAFGVIAGHVEASFFARRPLDRSAWDSSREAYRAFALDGG